MKKTLSSALLVLSFLLLVSSVSASLDVKVSERKACMVTPHVFDITITNQRDVKDTFYTRALGTYSKWAYVENTPISLQPGESKTSKISVYPPESAKMDKYNLTALVYSASNRSIDMKKTLCFIVFRGYSMKTGNFSLGKDKYSPGEEVQASLSVENDGTRDFEDASFSVKISKDGTEVGSTTKTFELETENRKTVSTSIELEEYQNPGDYKLVYRVEARGKKFSYGETSFEVNTVKDIRKTTAADRGILSSERTISITNRGNKKWEGTIKRTIDYPMALLVTAESASSKRVGMSSVYTWDLSMEPGESKSVSYQVNYWSLYIIIAILVLLAYRTYLYLQVPTIEKKVMKTELSEDKRIFTISVEVKNRLLGEAKNVIVEDFVPSVARVIEDFEGMKPKIENKEGEATLRWDLGKIGPGEDRVLHYRIKTLVEAVDYLKLPRASVQGDVKGKEFSKESGKVKIKVRE